MKHFFNCTLVCALVALTFSSCEDFLEEKAYTQLDTRFLTESEEGMQRMVIGMYYRDRELFRNGDDGETTLYLALLMGDDITWPRAGEGIPQFGRYNNLLPTNNIVERYWKQNYIMIEYANTVIESAKQMKDMSEAAQLAVAEAHVFRAHAYLRLLQRYDNVFLTTHSTTLNGVRTEQKVPAAADSVYNLIYTDLQAAIAVLPLTTTDCGRFTCGAARHILAKAAAQKGDWKEVLTQVNAIENSGVYHLLDEPQDVFGAADLNHAEAILVSQWAKDQGGWWTNTNVNPITNNGHRLSLHFTPTYNREAGMLISYENGGYPWGRLFPNSHLLSLYDQQKDKRYQQYYKHYWTYNNPEGLGRGKHVGDTIFPANPTQYQNVHPMCTKYNDSWTKGAADETMSCKDVIIYRLAETYLLGCEAAIHENQPDKALYYYNKTYTRAGNQARTAAVEMTDLLDEHARELAMEGDRWLLLKREGKLLELVRQWGGEHVVNNKGVVLNTDTAIRLNIDEHHLRWPIPQNQIDVMGPSFPQNSGY